MGEMIATNSVDNTSTLQEEDSDGEKKAPKSKSRVGGVAHPIAKAFFDALDNNTNSATTKSSTTSSKIRRQSESLKRKSQILGWRNRHCQDEFYPVSIATTTTTTTTKFTVRQVQRGEIEGTYGTGATVWPAAVVLIKYLEKHQQTLIKQKFVVDLGSGTGVTSIAAALLGASRVICTDGAPNVVKLATENINRYYSTLVVEGDDRPEGTTNYKSNDSKDCVGSDVVMINGCPINAQVYWWGDGSLKETMKNGGDNGRGGCDVILVADCVLPKLYPIGPLVEAIDELLINPDAVAILSYEHRYYPDYDPRDKFQELATSRGLQIDTIQQDQFDPIYCTDDIEIWHVRRKK